jgi:zinc transport system substrate-binding protein
MNKQHGGSGRRPTLLPVIAILCTAASCSRSDQPSSSDGGSAAVTKPVVYAVNYPLKYFADRIGGSLLEVELPVPADVDPAYWKPDADAVGRFQAADVILLNGADYAGWVEQASLPASQLVNTTAAVKDRYIRIPDAVTHQHGPEGEHSHEGLAFTTWLDPQIASEQARAVRDALMQLLPDQRSTLQQRCAALEQDLEALDKALEATVAGRPDQPLIVSHPVYQYFSKRYGLNSRSVHWEPDKMPSDESWKELEALLAQHPAKWMLWEADPLPEIVKKLEALDVRSVVFSPAANVPAQGDYLSVMQGNAERLKSVFQ